MSEEKKNQSSMNVSADIEDHKSSVGVGASVVVLSLFGLARQFNYFKNETSLTWADATIIAIGTGAAINALIKRKPIEVIGAVAVSGGVIAYRHHLFNVDIKVLFFVVLLIVGLGMIFGNMRKKS